MELRARRTVVGLSCVKCGYLGQDWYVCILMTGIVSGFEGV